MSATPLLMADLAGVLNHVADQLEHLVQGYRAEVDTAGLGRLLTQAHAYLTEASAIASEHEVERGGGMNRLADGGGLLRERDKFDPAAAIESVTDAVIKHLVSRRLVRCEAINPCPDSQRGAFLDPRNSNPVDASRPTSRSIADFADVLLPGWTKIERHIAETGYAILSDLEYRLCAVRDPDGNIHGFIGAVITDSDGTPVVVGLEGPHVFDEITGESQLSRVDVARCLGYLVCVYGDAISVLGPGDGRPGSLVGNFREAVRLLRGLVCEMRLDETDGADDGGDAADAQCDDRSGVHATRLASGVDGVVEVAA